jgi:ParB family chromosome partitioning protein
MENRRLNLADFIGRGKHLHAEPLVDVCSLPIDKLCRGRFQPRELGDDSDADLAELEQSIQVLGVIEPIVVRRLPEMDTYEILAGDRRWRAAQRAGLTSVPVVIRQADDHIAAAIALVENLQRKDLNPMEEAKAINRLMQEFGLSQEEIASTVGKSQSAISRIIGLLNLDPVVQSYLRAGQLEAGHAKVLLSLDPVVQRQLADKAISKGWSVRELERQKAALFPADTATGKQQRSATNRQDPDIVRLKSRLQEHLQAPVKLGYNKTTGHGCIEIRFSSLAECSGILQRLGLVLDGEF